MTAHQKRILGAVLFSLILLGCEAHPSRFSTIKERSPNLFTTEGTRAAAYVDVRGGTYRLPGQGECKAVTLIFVCHDCPISNGYAPEIVRLCAEYCHRGVAFCVVYADPQLSVTEAAMHVHQYGFPCPAVLDADLRLAGRYGARSTPEAIVLSADGAVVYRGRIDDRYFAYGTRRAEPTQRNLKDALDAVLFGRPVPLARTETLGCAIPFPAGAQP